MNVVERREEDVYNPDTEIREPRRSSWPNSATVPPARSAWPAWNGFTRFASLVRRAAVELWHRSRKLMPSQLFVTKALDHPQADASGFSLSYIGWGRPRVSKRMKGLRPVRAHCLGVRGTRHTVLATVLTAALWMFSFAQGIPWHANAFAATTAPEGLEVVSVNNIGQLGNSLSGPGRISRDGQYVAFSSYATNLVPDDTNGRRDVFLYNRGTRQVSRISVSTFGEEGNGSSWDPVISADGRYIAFSSDSTNLSAPDVNGWRDVFLHDRRTQTTSLVSVSSIGIQGNGLHDTLAISADGRFIVFSSNSETLVPLDLNRKQDVFVRDQLTLNTSRVSVSTDGTEGNNHSAGLPNLFGGFGSADISANGRYVVFDSIATNLVPGDTNGVADIFLHDRSTGTTERTSSSPTGIQRTVAATYPSISSDAQYISYHGAGVSVFDRETTQTELIVTDGSIPRLSRTGRYVIFQSSSSTLVPGDTNEADDVFLFDRATQSIERLPSCLQATGNVNGTKFPSVSGGGRYVAFSSYATNLVAGDANGGSDVFIQDRSVTCPQVSDSFPLLLRVTGQSQRQVRLLWSDEQPDEDHFQVQRSVGDTGDWQTIAEVPQKVVAYIDDAVQADSQYRYRVRAVMASGDSPGWSNIATARTPHEIKKYIALGDSFSAGEGVPPYFPDTHTDRNQCHRSSAAYATHVRAPGSQQTLHQRFLQQEEGVNWMFIACSSAVMKNVRREGVPQWNEPGTQLQQGAVTEEADLVSITIGGNDAEFVTVLKLCSFAHDCLDPGFRPFDDMTFTAWLAAKIDSLYQPLAETYSEVVDAGPNAILAVLGYPHMFPDTYAEQTCMFLIGWTPDEQRWLNQMGDRLNGVIATATQNQGAYFVDVTSHFWNHEICAEGGEWINHLDFGDLGSSFHPNHVGQQEYATPLNSFLAQGSMLSGATDIQDRPQAVSEPRGDLGVLSASYGGTARVGEAGSIFGEGFHPGSLVSLHLLGSDSGRFSLGEVPARPDGTVAADVEIPLGIGQNQPYLLQATGTGPDGSERLLVEVIYIAPPI